MSVKEDSLVEIEYEAYVDTSSSPNDSHRIVDTLKFRLGTGKINKRLESKLLGMEKQEEKEFNLMLKKIDQNLLIRKQKSEFSFDGTPEQGKQIELCLPNGENVQGIIRKVTGDDIVIDLNSPLAGKIIYFKVQILDILS